MLKNTRGFTLIELMIVVAIIGILASVGIPRFADMLEKSREGATKGNVAAIKSAITIYYSENSGVWPGGIDDVLFVHYLAIIPDVKVRHIGGHALSGNCRDVFVINTEIPDTIATDTDGWRYNKAGGDVWVNNSQVDSRNTMYSMYGHAE